MFWLILIIFFVVILLGVLLHDVRIDGRTKLISLLLRIKQRRSGLYKGGKFDRTKLGTVPKEDPGVVHGVECFDVETEYSGSPISIRFFHLPELKKEEKYSLLIYVHGGFFFGGSPSNKSDSDFVRHIVSKTGTIVASVDYQKSPEHPFPLPLNDTYNSILYLFNKILSDKVEIEIKKENEEEEENEIENEKQNEEQKCQKLLSKIDPTRIAICGSSSGANLALSTIMKLRDEENQFSKVINAQLLLFPMLNHHPIVDSRKLEKNSWTLPESLISWAEDQYCGGNKECFQNPYFAPLKAKSFRNFPDTLVLTADRDPLHGEALLLKEKILNDSGNVSFLSYPNQTHEFTHLDYLKDSQKALIEITQFLLNYHIGKKNEK
ncbi:ab hydrolase superfamily protein c4a8.06c [Anaeramoeba flamelloides]|uniref:Ab hydrolase superfamily protein c4a8.06c n=1 Tax=Anaeramoeba flamelloides TaxID=1746091 RepID=A0ABQ8YZI9_9EUKA|nr:ab hydrolase superfamily protein c4a8.06c [Anaeramoeba flamelloides]